MSAETTPNSSSFPVARPLLAGVLVILLAAAGVIYLDPFGWHIIDRLGGQYDAALVAVPAESSAYIGLNLLSANLTRLDELQDTFARATADIGVNTTDLGDAFDAWLMEELSLSVDEDVIPWIGQHVGLAIIDLEIDEFGELASLEWLLSAESRDESASDQFLVKLSAAWAEANREDPVVESYDGIVITRFEQVAFGRSRRLVLLGSSANAVKQAVDAQKGDSLVASPGYEQAVERLPADRFLTTYINGQQLNRLIASLPSPLPRISPENLPTASIQGAAIGLSLIDEGIKVDVATVYDPQQLSVLQRTALQTHVEEPETAQLFPSDTALYLVGQGVDLTWATLRRALIAEIGRADFTESMRLFAQEFNINPDEEFFPLLDGEAAFVLQPVGDVAPGESVLAATVLVGSTDPETLAANVAAFSDRVGDPAAGIGQVTLGQTTAGHSIYQFETPLMPDLEVSYGVAQEYLMVSTNSAALESLRFGEGISLSERGDYQELWLAFAPDMVPGLFMDVPGTLAMLQRSEIMDAEDFETMAAWLSPLSFVAGTHQADENISMNTLIFFIESE